MDVWTQPPAVAPLVQEDAYAPSRGLPESASVRDALRYRPLFVLLGAAVALRIATLALYFPGVVWHADSLRFALVAPDVHRIFDDTWHPAGYPMFLGALRLVSDQVWFTIAAQHLLGLLAGTALYLAVTRLGAPRWLGLIPAAVYLFSGDVLFFEHTLVSEQLALALTALALSAAILGLRPKVDTRWLAASGALATGAWLTRAPFLVVVFAVVSVAALGVTGRRSRATAGGAAALGAAFVFGLYLLAFQVSGGRYLGLWDMTGWQLYGRVAPFAACDQFDVPEGAGTLCESRPPADRPASFFYTQESTSPAVREFGYGSPQADGLLYDFAIRAIRAQPRDYASAVISDLARYVRKGSPPFTATRLAGLDWTFASRPAWIEAIARHQLAARYDGTKVSAPGEHLLGDYQSVMRVHGLLIAVLLLLTLAGAIWGRGPGRFGAALFGSTSVLLFLGPVAASAYDFRYGIPPATLLACAGTLAAYALWVRIDQRRSPPAASGSSTTVPTRPD